MPTLHERLAPLVRAWRDAGYPHEPYPAVSEILEWARDPDSGVLRFLRGPQALALEARPDEDRPVTIVCLRIEVAAQAWVDEWNALRRGPTKVNKIQVIELRSYPK